jgi:probable rRNA maturation factor
LTALIYTIEVTSTCAGWSEVCPTPERFARDAAELAAVHGMAASGLACPAPVELGITLASAVEQQRLNRVYREQDVPTNVLAFPAWEPGTHIPAGAPLLLGDVVLAFETVMREACEQDKPVADHLCHLVVHGVLHLLGFDHLTQPEAARMESLETSILAELGVPDPYGDTMSSIEPEPVER